MSETAGLLPRPVTLEQSLVHAELDRVGASFRKVGTQDYISVQLRLDEVKLPAARSSAPDRGSARSGRRWNYWPRCRTMRAWTLSGARSARMCNRPPSISPKEGRKMAVLIRHRAAGLGPADYDKLSPPLVEQLKKQPGFVLHVSYDTPDGFVVAEVWETKDQH